MMNYLFLKNLRLRAKLILTIFVTSCVSAQAAIYEHDAGAQEEAKMSQAKFKMWIPDDLDEVKGLFVMMSGRNGDGRRFATNPRYQKLAAAHGFGIVGVYFHSIKSDTNTYQIDMKGATAEVLVEAVQSLSEISSMESIAKAPFILMGSSAGANVSVQFPRSYPKRTLAVVAKAPTIGPGLDGAKKDEVPMLVMTGAQDKPHWIKFSEANWKKLGSKSIWTKVHHQNLGHKILGAETLIDAYINAIIPMRLSEDSADLEKLTKTKVWAGDLESYEIQEAKKKSKTTTWIPNEETAKAWQEFLKN